MFGIRRKYLQRLADGICHHPTWFVLAAFLAGLTAWVITDNRLAFKTSRNDLIGSDTAYWKRYQQFTDEFSSVEDYLVTVESADPSRNREAVDQLRAALLAPENNPHPADSSYAQQFAPSDVFARVNFDAIQPWFLYYLTPDELRQIRNSVHEFHQLVVLLESHPSLQAFFEAMDQMLQQMATATPADRARMATFLPTISGIVNQVANSGPSSEGEGLLSPWATAFFRDEMVAAAREQMKWKGYHVFEDGHIFVVLIHPREHAATQDHPHHAETIAKIRRILDEVRPRFSDVTIKLTGEPVLDHDEMVASQRDAHRATILTLLLCGLLFMFGFHEWLRPLLATVCIALVVVISLGVATLWPGYLNIITITFAVMIIGLGIDLSIQFLARYEEGLSRGMPRVQAVRTAISQTGPSILTAGITNAAAFFAMTLSGFRGTIELGVIAGAGLLVATTVTLTVLPPLLLLVHRRRESTDIPARAVATSLERGLLQHPYLVLAVCTAGTGLAALFCWQVRFDYNILNLQSRELESVEAELRLIHSGAQSTIYASVVANSLDEARQLHARLELLPTVGSVASIAPLIPVDQEAKRDMVRAIKAELQDVSITIPQDETVDAVALLRALNVLRLRANDLSGRLTNKQDAPSVTALQSLAANLARARESLLSADPTAASRSLGVYQRMFFTELEAQLKMMAQQESDRPLTPDALPPEIRQVLIGKTGKLLLRVFPSQNIWERAALESFVADVQSVAPEATGTPLGLYEFIGILRQGYRNAALWAFGVIAVLVFVDFKRVRATLLTLLPLSAGVTWMMAIMAFPRIAAEKLAAAGFQPAAQAIAACEIPFNPANIMVLPLIVGIGVAYGIYVVQRFREDRESVFYAKSTGRAVILSGLTTLVAFGSLIFGAHHGIQSLGLVMVIGVACCLVASLVLLPALLEIARRNNWEI